VVNILVLTTYRGFLTTSLLCPDNSINTVSVDDVKNKLESLGYTVACKHFEDITDPTQYQNHYVVYASSEDIGLFYKDFIEDTILLLHLAGAIIVPKFEFFRAHHNKSLMEGMRGLFENDCFKTIVSRSYASKESFFGAKDRKQEVFPVVVKPSAGSGSVGVRLAHDEKSFLKAIKKSSRIKYWEYDIRRGYWPVERLRNLYRKLGGRPKLHYAPRARKFVVQNFIPNLLFDYKVLIFDKKYYVLKRENRVNDFRASGSGKFTFPDKHEEVSGVLDFAKLFTKEIDSPFSSLDIGFDMTDYHLLEFQLVNFGPYTLQYSKWYFEHDGFKWVKIMGESNLETEYVRAIDAYIRRTPK